MNTYEQRQAARAARKRARAEKLESQANALRSKNETILGVMNGTPILRGHHSEKRHRRELARIHRDTTKSIEARQEAAALRKQANAIEDSSVISSDDPEAILKLRAQLADLESRRTKAKQINATIRVVRKNGDGWEAMAVEALSALGYSTSTAQALVRPDTVGDVGVPTYRTSLWAAEARRIEARIADLEKRAAHVDRRVEFPGGVIEECATDNRTRITFEARVSREMYSELKRAGFRWTPSLGVWQRHMTEAAWHAAKRVCEVTS